MGSALEQSLSMLDAPLLNVAGYGKTVSAVMDIYIASY